VPFNTDGAQLHLTREGGHSHRRIVHVDDATGWAVQSALLKAAEDHPNITLLPGRAAVDLITGRHELRYSGSGRVWGIYALDEASGRVEAHTARATILATGGAGRVYQFSTAPRGATGDGIAMAWRAGARVGNMEMMQFHPTCLYNLEVKNFLITEAVRGEGGRLINPRTGKRFMEFYDPARMELAPRDVVARAIGSEIKRFGLDYVHLDISHQPADFVKGHFPNIHEKLTGLGIDMTAGPIPVVPAQHYTCGGIVIDLAGRTDLPGLYAAGECSESGLHGANRLASNSLLECFVFGEAAAADILDHWDAFDAPPQVRAWDESRVTDSDEEVVIKQNWTEIRRFMWNYVGIVRRRGGGILRRLPRHHRPDRTAQPRADGGTDRGFRAEAERKPGAALHARLSGPAGRGAGHGAGAVRGKPPALRIAASLASSPKRYDPSNTTSSPRSRSSITAFLSNETNASPPSHCPSKAMTPSAKSPPASSMARPFSAAWRLRTTFLVSRTYLMAVAISGFLAASFRSNTQASSHRACTLTATESAVSSASLASLNCSSSSRRTKRSNTLVSAMILIHLQVPPCLRPPPLRLSPH
jgi:aspartate oxidase